MTRILIGFFLGLMIAGAMGQVPNFMATLPNVTLNAAVGPDGRQAPIRVDTKGYVICSTERP